MPPRGCRVEGIGQWIIGLRDEPSRNEWGTTFKVTEGSRRKLKPTQPIRYIRPWSLVAGLSAALLLISACVTQPAPAPTTTAAPAPTQSAAPAPAPVPLTPLTVTIGMPNFGITYFHMLVAEKKGFLKEAGLNATVSEQGTGGSAIAQLVVAGRLDIGFSNVDHVTNMILEGQPAVAIAAVDQKNPYSMVAVHTDTFKSGKITSLKDLGATKIGITRPGSGSHKFMAFLAIKAGLDPSKMEFVGLNNAPGIMNGVKLKTVEAGFVSADVALPAVEEGWATLIWDGMRDDKQWNDLFGGPMPTSGIFAMKDYVQKNPEVVQRVVNAMLMADKYIATAPLDELTDILLSYSPTLNRQGAANGIDLFRKGNWNGPLALSEKGWNNMLDFLVVGELIKESDRAKLSYKDSVVPQFTEKAYASVK